MDNVRKPKYYIYPGLNISEREEFVKTLEFKPLWIMETVAKYYHLSVDRMISNMRYTEYKVPRFIAAYFVKKHTALTPDQIAIIFKRERTTILHSVKQVQNWIDTNDSRKADIEFLQNYFVVK